MRLRQRLLVLGVTLFAPLVQARPAEIRASQAGEGFVAFRNDAHGTASVEWAKADAAPESVVMPQGRWVLDASVDKQEVLWLAVSKVPRTRGLEIWKSAKDGLEKVSELDVFTTTSAWFLPSNVGRALAHPQGIWELSGAQPTKLVGWDVDGYGFYDASFVRRGPAWEALVPVFNTCRSYDYTEELALYRAVQGKVTKKPMSLPPGEGNSFLGADGNLYAISANQDSCWLSHRDRKTGAWSTKLRVPSSACLARDRHNGSHTAVLLSGRVLRVNAGRVRWLGHLHPTHHATDIHPDSRGRVLVLLQDGTVWRYASNSKDVQIARVFD